MLRIKKKKKKEEERKKETLGRPRGLLNVTNYSMQNSTHSREIDTPFSYTPSGQDP